MSLTDDERRAFALGFAANIAAFILLALIIGIAKAAKS